MSEVLAPDVCVIGAGSAGLTVAAAAASFGASVVLVEKGRMGGDCLNAGCIPSKALIAAARHARDARDAIRFGVEAGAVEVDFAKVMERLRHVVATLEPNDSVERFTGLGVTVIRGAAAFKDRSSLVVEGVEIRARRFVLATGSRPAIPPIPNLQTVPYLTNETVFGLKRRPVHLIVIGGGAVGLELAQAFRRLGSAVTVLERGAALAKHDPEVAALLLETLRQEGIVIHEKAEVTRTARRGRNAVRATFRIEGGNPATVEGTHLLVAAGRRPDLDGLGLAAAGIRFDESGVKVNARLRTRNRCVYAVGDVTGGPQFTHWAGYQAGLVVRSILFRFGGKVDPDILPWTTFTDPEFAHVGLDEDEARRRHGSIQVLRWPFCENDRAQAEGATRGLVKVLATRGGRVLGVDILGRNAGELIAPWIVAVAGGVNLKTIASAVFPYPTMAEAGRRAAILSFAPRLNTPFVKRVVRLLGRFG